MVSAVPQIEGLTIDDVLGQFRGKAVLLRHLPDERDWVHMDRKWICDILFSLDQVRFQAFITAAMQRRKDKLELSRNLLVEMRPEFVQAFQSCLNYSCKVKSSLIVFKGESGRSASLLKGSSKRKRTRAELEEVKGEEDELKEDKQAFLQQVKRLRLEKMELEAQLTEMEAASMLDIGMMSGQASNRPSSQFII